MLEPLLPALFNLRRHGPADRRIVALLDSRSGVEAGELVRHLRPWPWARIVTVLRIDRGLSPGLLEALALGGPDLALILSNDQALVMDARRICRALELPLVDPVVPQQDAREFGLYQEMLHHDIELGGFNQWADRDSQSGASVLRRLSPVHSKRVFPLHVLPYLDALRQARQGRPLSALDIGCGSISNLRWGALGGWLTITGVDPLLDVYAVVRERHGLSVLPDIRCAHELCIGAEALGEHVQPSSYDFAYSSNALDHVSNPGAVVTAVTTCLRPGGLFALNVFTREGTRENWWSCHQFDMYVDEAGDFVCETRDGHVEPLFPQGCGLVVREITANTSSVTALVLERVPGHESSRPEESRAWEGNFVAPAGASPH